MMPYGGPVSSGDFRSVWNLTMILSAGRIDLELHLKKATRLQAFNLFLAFYGDNDSARSKLVAGQVLPEDIASLASQWAAHVNDEEWSHAELQGETTIQ
jgi:hypothetical protein